MKYIFYVYLTFSVGISLIFGLVRLLGGETDITIVNHHSLMSVLCMGILWLHYTIQKVKP